MRDRAAQFRRVRRRASTSRSAGPAAPRSAWCPRRADQTGQASRRCARLATSRRRPAASAGWTCFSRPSQKRSARPARSSGCWRYGPGTSPQSRGVGNTLPGLQMPVRIERAPHELHRVEIVRGEHLRHRCLLVGADAVLAGDRAAGVDAVRAGSPTATCSACSAWPGNGFVVADERMQVAVAGVKDVADAQARARFESANPAQHLRQLRARHDAVLHVVVRRHAAHRRERRLASLPDPRALVVVLRDLDRRWRRPPADGLDACEQLVDFDSRAVELDDEHRVGLREVRMHGGFGGVDRQPVHHLDRRRHDAVAR